MPDHPGFLEAILAAPDDDAPRLAYADWLGEHGQEERAEFIRVQCALARLRGRKDRRGRRIGYLNAAKIKPLMARERELLEASALQGWYSVPVCPMKWTWRRGFVEAVTCTAAAWLEHADAILAAQPVQEVGLTTWPTVEQQIIGRIHPAFGWHAPRRLEGRARWHSWESLGSPGDNDAITCKLLTAEWPGISIVLPSREEEARQNRELIMDRLLHGESFETAVGERIDPADVEAPPAP